MKMAKASQADLEMAMELSSALDALEKRFFPVGMKRDDAELFDGDNPHHCEEALAHLLELYKRASLMRVVWGCAVMFDPRNRLVDPNADTIEHHPDRADLAAEVERLRADLAAMTADRDSWADQAEQRVADWDDEQRRCAGALEALGAERRKVGGLAAEVERLRAERDEAVNALPQAIRAERRKVEALEKVLHEVDKWQRYAYEEDALSRGLSLEQIGAHVRAALAASQKGGE